MTITTIVPMLLGAGLLGLALLLVAAMVMAGSLLGMAERVSGLASWPARVPGGMS